MSAPAIISSGTAAGGPPVGGTGTPNTIPRWTGPSTLGDSVITQSGTFIGVGVPTPAYPLQVQTLAANTNTISLINGTGNISRLGWVQNGSTTLAFTAIDGDGRATGYMSFLTAAVERMRITDTGNVGIGTASPNAQLAVYAASLPTFSLWNATNHTRFAVNAGDCYVDVGFGGAAGSIIFRRSSSATESARIDSAGRLLVGTSTSPTRTDVPFVVARAGDVIQYGYNASSARGIYQAYGASGGVGYWELGDLAGPLGSETLPTTYLFANGSTKVLSVANSGWGLKLPATPGNTDPNTLDAYVDGGTAGGGGKTWTPADTSGAGLTLTVNSAQYVQVGKLVVMTADITYPVTASAAVAALSLPVSPAVNYFHAGSTGYQTTPAIAGLAPMVKNTAMNMWAYDTQQTNAQLSGKRLIFTVSYFMG